MGKIAIGVKSKEKSQNWLVEKGSYLITYSKKKEQKQNKKILEEMK